MVDKNLVIFSVFYPEIAVNIRKAVRPLKPAEEIQLNLALVIFKELGWQQIEELLVEDNLYKRTECSEEGCPGGDNCDRKHRLHTTDKYYNLMDQLLEIYFPDIFGTSS